MAWTTPKTWSSEPLTSINLNTYIRDNQNHMYARLGNNTENTIDEASDYSTTSTSFVDVDSTNLALTITTNGGNVLVGFAGMLIVAGARYAELNVSVDGSDYFAEDGVVAHYDTSTGGYIASFVVLIEGLSIGSHTFKLRWKIDNTGTINMPTDTYHPQFWAQEL